MSADALVVTVDRTGRVMGVAGLLDAHLPPGQLHLAVSVQLLDSDNRWIVQRRTASKRLFPSRWANSCCTHPTPGESLAAAASRRVVEELGVQVVTLEHRGTFVYRADDSESGMVEHELDHVYLGRVTDVPRPSAGEVDDVAALTLAEASTLLASGAAAPWAARVLALAAPRPFPAV
jgi:isopentenyl-diphosphate delta-isomerase